MKRKIATIATALALVCVMLACLCACGSTWGKIKSAYEKAGYKESADLQTYQTQINNALGEDKDAVTVHAMVRTADGLDLTKIAFVAIIEFKSTDDMKKLVEEHEDLKDALKGTYDDLQQSDAVNGNCLLLIPVGTDALSIFKGTK